VTAATATTPNPPAPAETAVPGGLGTADGPGSTQANGLDGQPGTGTSVLTFDNRTNANSGLGSDFVLPLGVYESGGRVYAGTAGGGLGISIDGGQTFDNRTNANSGLGSDIVFGVYESGGTIYAGTDGGLGISTDGANFTTYTTAEGLADNFVVAVYASGGAVYAGTNVGGLSIGT
jgi:hypothetical protein